jgi:hypothetical protein
MSMLDDISLTLRTAAAPHPRWQAFAAVAGMLLMWLAMVAAMWFLSVEPSAGLSSILAGALSVAGLLLWRAMLARALAPP